MGSLPSLYARETGGIWPVHNVREKQTEGQGLFESLSLLSGLDREYVILSKVAFFLMQRWIKSSILLLFEQKHEIMKNLRIVGGL